MNIFLLVILDTREQARLVAAFTTYIGAGRALGAYGDKHKLMFEVDSLSPDQFGRVTQHYTSTDGMVKAVLLETELMEVS